ncbi:hypothetical protein GC722_07255 [Auraticoccus sp. F435]|uniref:Uncharacterized protein n=1 Tax=Auraticoccus cholistanensis TaxID=2656650 RepID=A0A6A9V0L3_9ACTN|nr:hypothetical protein [Auraticoccus cholistanensis]MVA75819.1 hypothetical protein [Auraticoccus cholistanensis]
MRTARILGGVAAAVVAANLVAVPASATGRPTHTLNTVHELSCAFSTTTGESVFFQASGGSASGESGSSFFVEDQQSRTVLEGWEGTADFGPHFTAEVTATVPSTGEFVGTATFSADVVEGEPVVEEVDDRDGNIRTTGTITTSEFTFSNVSASVPGYSPVPDELSCSGSKIVFDIYTTNPPVHVVRSKDFNSAICAVEGIPHAQVLLSGESRWAPYAEVVVDDGTNPLKAEGDVAMRGPRGRLVTPLLEVFTGDTVADLTLRVELTQAGAPVTTVERDGRSRVIETVTPFEAHISVETTDGRRGEVTCAAEELQHTSMTFRR